jgi:hypothetical protein
VLAPQGCEQRLRFEARIRLDPPANLLPDFREGIGSVIPVVAIMPRNH